MSYTVFLYCICACITIPHNTAQFVDSSQLKYIYISAASYIFEHCLRIPLFQRFFFQEIAMLLILILYSANLSHFFSQAFVLVDIKVYSYVLQLFTSKPGVFLKWMSMLAPVGVAVFNFRSSGSESVTVGVGDQVDE